MKPLEASLTKDGSIIKGSAIDLGTWDIQKGMERSIFLHNPNTHAKAVLSELKNKDSRLLMDIPDTIMPQQTKEVKLKINAQTFKTDADEKAFFTNLVDQLSGQITWEVP